VSRNKRGPLPGLVVATAVAGDCYSHSINQTRTENQRQGSWPPESRRVKNGEWEWSTLVRMVLEFKATWYPRTLTLALNTIALATSLKMPKSLPQRPGKCTLLLSLLTPFGSSDSITSWALWSRLTLDFISLTCFSLSITSVGTCDTYAKKFTSRILQSLWGCLRPAVPNSHEFQGD